MKMKLNMKVKRQMKLQKKNENTEVVHEDGYKD